MVGGGSAVLACRSRVTRGLQTCVEGLARFAGGRSGVAASAEPRCFWRCTLAADLHALVVHGEAAVEPLMDVDVAPSEADPGWPGEELESVFAELDGIVGGHGAYVLEGEQFLQPRSRGERTIGSAFPGCRDREPSVEARQEVPEDLIRFLDRRRMLEPELSHQAILERAPQSFDPSFSLG